MRSIIWHTCLLQMSDKPQCQILLKALICSKQTLISSLAMSCSEDTCCPLSLWCLQCCCWHSAGCRTSWVCLQHHAAVVTSNGVTVRGSKFPPTFSTHCQLQHSAIHKTIPTMWNSNNPSCCDIQGPVSSVQHHGSLCSQAQQSILWCLSRTANIQQPKCHTTCSVLSTVTCCWSAQLSAPNVQLPTHNNTL